MRQHSCIGMGLFVSLVAIAWGPLVIAATAAVHGSTVVTAAAAYSDGSPAAQNQSHLITCWYNTSKKYSGADDAGPGASAGGPVSTGHGGDYAWSYTIAAADGTNCPKPDMPAGGAARGSAAGAGSGAASGAKKSAHLVMCWYSTSKQYKGANDAYPGATVGGPFNTGHMDDHAWVYTIAAADGKSCPHTMPAPVDPNTIHLVEDMPSEAQPGLITCWYNTAKKYAGADSAHPGVSAGGPVSTGHGGDYAWSYTIQAVDGQSCPKPDMPAPARSGKR